MFLVAVRGEKKKKDVLKAYTCELASERENEREDKCIK
jgi:hypothetical protein